MRYQVINTDTDEPCGSFDTLGQAHACVHNGRLDAWSILRGTWNEDGWLEEPVCIETSEPDAFAIETPAAWRLRLDGSAGPVLHREAKRPSQDGFFWPIVRVRMQHAPSIIKRMIEDMAAIARRKGVEEQVYRADLLALGWTARQCVDHGATARDSFTREIRAGKHRNLPVAA